MYKCVIYRSRIQLLWAIWLYNRQRMLSKYVIDFYHICILYFLEHISSAKQWHVRYFLSMYWCLVSYIFHIILMIYTRYRFTDDRQTYGIDTQFLWGSALMINPVLEEVRSQSLFNYLLYYI